MTKELNIQIGKLNKPQIEKLDAATFNKSIFTEQYRYVLTLLNQYLESKNSVNYGMEDVGRQTDSDNNIFAFVGDRGTGKTSCMMSVAQLLGNKDNLPSVCDLLQYAGSAKLRDTDFYIMDLIDPSFFDKDHNIIAIFIAQLYKCYSEYRDKPMSALSEGELRERNTHESKLLNAFKTAQRNLMYMIEHPAVPDYYDNFTKLELLSASIALKKDIHDLVACMMAYMGKPLGTQLLVQIDDIDLNASEADRMSEEIRKYLIQDNIIVFLALKLDQLALIKRKKFQDDYTTKEHKLIADKDIISMMVDRYLTKFVPQGQRIFMPEAENYLNYILNIVEDDEKRYREAVRQAIPDLIFSKTRYLFYNSPQRISPIIPRNLRELTQLIEMLFPMKNFRNENPTANKYNKTLFKKFFFENWADTNLSEEAKRIIKELMREEEASQFNAHVVKLLCSYFEIAKWREYPSTEEIDYIIRDSNISYNISLGDVFGLIGYIENIATSLLDRNLLFAIKTLYSIRLYEYYDEKTDAINVQAAQIQNRDAEGNNIYRDVLSSGILYGISNYDKLVAGNFANSRMTKFLPNSSDDGSMRTARKINISPIKTCINELLPLMGTDEREPQLDEHSVLKIKLVEFFLLCISRDYQTKDYTAALRFRSDDRVSYADDLKGRTNVYLDLNAFFFNVNRIKECYSRIEKGADFFDKIKSLPHECSLYGAFWDYAASNRGWIEDGEEHQWLSVCSFRNAEIIDDFVGYVERNNKETDSSSIKQLAGLFNNVSNYSIKTYDFSDGDNGPVRYEIKFEYARAVKQLLDNVAQDDELSQLFTSIYAENKNIDFHIDERIFFNQWKRDKEQYTKRGVKHKICKANALYKDTTLGMNRLDEVIKKLNVTDFNREQASALITELNHLADADNNG